MCVAELNGWLVVFVCVFYEKFTDLYTDPEILGFYFLKPFVGYSSSVYKKI